MAWSYDKLKENLISSDIKSIKKIPLGRYTEDEWAWTQERNGNFTVKSAYRLLAANKHALRDSSSGNHSQKYWQKLWKMSVPPKVRCFWWRVIKKFVPTRAVLKNKHVEQIAHCEACGASEESIPHALFECTWAQLFLAGDVIHGWAQIAIFPSKLMGY